MSSLEDKHKMQKAIMVASDAHCGVRLRAGFRPPVPDIVQPSDRSISRPTLADKQQVQKALQEAFAWLQALPVPKAASGDGPSLGEAVVVEAPAPEATESAAPTFDESTIKWAYDNGYFDSNGRMLKDFPAGSQPSVRNYLACARNVVVTRKELEVMDANLATDKDGDDWWEAKRRHNSAVDRVKELWKKLSKSQLIDMESLPKVATWTDLLRARLREQKGDDKQKKAPGRDPCDCGVSTCRRGATCRHLLAAAKAARSPAHFLREALAKGGFHGSSPLAYLNVYACLDLPATFAFAPPPLFQPREGIQKKMQKKCSLGSSCLAGSGCKGGRACRRANPSAHTERVLATKARLREGRPVFRLNQKTTGSAEALRLDFDLRQKTNLGLKTCSKATRTSGWNLFVTELFKGRPSAQASAAWVALPAEERDAFNDRAAALRAETAKTAAEKKASKAERARRKKVLRAALRKRKAEQGRSAFGCQPAEPDLVWV
jgi:hypothetical protein